ncbi:MAG: zf-TFIIB domain-containing protein [Nanoarchaeota archaeon]
MRQTMQIVHLKCPHCGASFKTVRTTGVLHAFCHFCGGKVEF